MKKIKNLILTFFLIFILLSPILISKSQNKNPIFAIQSVSSQQISGTTIQNFAIVTKISGNIFYLLSINATFIFPQDTPFEGFLSIGCGLNVALVNSSAWQVINFAYSCPYFSSGQTMKAGIYNSTLLFYINSIENYNSTVYPKTITFYIHSNMNDPQYRSDNYSINLAYSVTYFNLSLVSYHSIGFSNYVIPLGLVGIVIVPLGVYTIVEYRKYRKEKILNNNIKSFGNYLSQKLKNKEKLRNQTLHDETLQKLEDIISENAK